MPVLATPTVAVDPVVNGRVSVTTKYHAPAGVAKVTLRICTGTTCAAGIVFTPTTSAADQAGHVFTVTGLSPGSKAAQSRHPLSTTRPGSTARRARTAPAPSSNGPADPAPG